MILKSLASRRLATNHNNAIIRAAIGNSSTTSSITAAPSTCAVASRPMSTGSLMQQRCAQNFNSISVITTTRTHCRRWLSDETKPPTGAEDGREGDEKPVQEGGEDGPPEEEGPSETEKLKEELAEMKNQLLRSLAEQENIRSIARRDVESARNFSVKSFAKSLLEVADNLDRALENVDEGEVSKNETLKTFVEGIEMTGNGLVKALKSNGVEPFCEKPGDEFDAEKHQALMEYADPKATPGTVGVVMKKGYMLNGRVLRAAEVGVVKK